MEQDLGREYTRGDSEREVRRPKRSKTPFIIMLVLVICTVIVFIVTYIKKTRTYTSWTEVTVNEGIDLVGTRGGVCEYQNGFIRYNPDGAEAIGADGKALWNISFNQSSPTVRVCGKTAVVADFGGRSFNITDGTGSNVRLEVSEDIVDAAISEQGVTAILTDGVTSDHVRMYSGTGTLLIEMETKAITDGFPMAIALSPDGRKLVTSYIRIGETQESWVTFYNFGEVGQNFADKVVGSYSFGEKLVPDIRFVGNERVAAFYDQGFALYKFKETPSEILKTSLNNHINAVFSGPDYFGVSTSLTTGGNEVTLYDIAGKVKKRITTGLDFTGVSATDDELVLYNSSSCIIFRTDGSEKFRTAVKERIAGLFPAGNDRYLVVSNNAYKLMRLVSAKEEESEEAPMTAE